MPRVGARSSATRGQKAKPRPKLYGDKRGGARPGAGRKQAEPTGARAGHVPWREIKEAAEAGVTYEVILAGVSIHADDIASPEVQERIRAIVDRGNAEYKIELSKATRRGALKKRPSVNTLAMANRNILDWDQQLAAQGQGEPDLAGVGVRLVELVEKLAKRPGAAPEGP